MTFDIADISDLAASLIARFLTTSLSFSDYKDLACWLGAYGYDGRQERKFTELDSDIHKHLVNNTTLSTEQIFLKLLFIRDLNHGYKAKAAKLFLTTDTAQLS